MRKYPTLIPGKELGPAHFESYFACLLKGGQLYQEIKPLLEYGEKRGWVSEKICEEGLKSLLSYKNPIPIWQTGVETWQRRVPRGEPEYGPIWAGWLVLKNLKLGYDQWLSFRYPYKGLEVDVIRLLPRLKIALMLSRAFEECLPEKEKDSPRHILAVCLLRSKGITPDDLDIMLRQALGKEAFSENINNKIFALCYGVKKGNAWIRAEIKTITEMTLKIRSNLPEVVQEEYKQWLNPNP